MITFQRIGYMGRLGNQMFQFASTLGISKMLNLEAAFPIENCVQTFPIGPFDPSIGEKMLVKCDLIDCFKIDPVYFIPRGEIPVSSIFNESIFTYDDKVTQIKENTDLYGYFQTDKYFSEYTDLILSQFSFKRQYRDPAVAYIEKIRESNKGCKIVSIHVRRGDYVMYPDHHPVCSKEYYDICIKEIKKSTKDRIKFLVFSDDTIWCKSEFSGDDFEISNLANPYSELCAMSLCDHNIIANSSFSWWGAWLNVNPEKIIFSPSRWFGNAMNKNTSDVYCKDWIIV